VTDICKNAQPLTQFACHEFRCFYTVLFESVEMIFHCGYAMWLSIWL